ncbi:MAG TPA: hypothetical protein VK756_00900, partial [Solirubrobacteraceae bacterium]|nr:hypothetical protein [Solirubrobacteraceae bacterium]
PRRKPLQTPLNDSSSPIATTRGPEILATVFDFPIIAFEILTQTLQPEPIAASGDSQIGRPSRPSIIASRY